VGLPSLADATLADATLADSAPSQHANVIVGPERLVTFHTDSLGIKLSRHSDGLVRVLSISPYRDFKDSQAIRSGHLQEGDLLRQVLDVDLRHPIDSNVWKLTVGLIKMAPRPLTVLVATEYEEVEDVRDADCRLELSSDCGADAGCVRSLCQQCELTGQTILPPSSPKMGKFATRQVVFYEQSLGVKLQHTPSGYVIVHSTTPPSMTATNSRSGELKQGDIVLQVGGVWDLHHPISINAWGILVKFIRECRRPMRMVVADESYLATMISPGSTSEEEDEVQSVDGERMPLTPSSVVDDEPDNRMDGEDTMINDESTIAISTTEISSVCNGEVP